MRRTLGRIRARTAACAAWVSLPPARLRGRTRLRLGFVVLGIGLVSPGWADPLALDLNAYRGKVVYLDFWASWCVPCRTSFPWMSQLQAELGPEGLVVIAVNLDRVRAEADQFLQHSPPGFEVVYDPGGVTAQKFGLRGMPTSFLIDRNGVVRLRHEGFLRADQPALAARVRSLVADK